MVRKYFLFIFIFFSLCSIAIGATVLEQTGQDGVAAFGDVGGVDYDRAQKIVTYSNYTITGLDLQFGANENSPTGNVEYRIETDSTGTPSGSLVDANATCTTSITENQWNSCTFSTSFSLSAGTYWLVWIAPAQPYNNRWSVYRDTGDPYADGSMYLSTNDGSSWSESGSGQYDLTFKLYGTSARNRVHN